MDMVKAVLFDFNNTIMHCQEWMMLEIHDMPRQAFNRFAELSLVEPLTAKQLEQANAINARVRKTANESAVETSHVEDLIVILQGLGLVDKIPIAVIEETVTELHMACVPHAELLPGITEVLPVLLERGYRLGVISNAAYAAFLHGVFDAHDLAQYFEMVLVSADVKARKPGTRIFEIALQSMGLQAEDVLYVGDDPVKDVDTSKRLGMKAAWFRFDPAMEMPPDALPPDIVITNHLQLLTYLPEQPT